MSTKPILISGPNEVFEGESLSLKCKVNHDYLENKPVVIGLEQVSESGVHIIVTADQHGTVKQSSDSFSAYLVESKEFLEVTFTFNKRKYHSGTYRCFCKGFPKRTESDNLSVQVKGIHYEE